MMTTRFFLAAAVVTGLPLGSALHAAPSPATDVVSYDTVQRGGFPEGVAWDAPTRTFFVSSLRSGAIGQVTLDGSYRIFADDPSLVTTSGMLVERARNRVLVCNEDVGIGERSRPETRTKLDQVVEFDLMTGQLRRTYDFSALVDGPHLPNDLTMDPAGNVYVTDSFSPVIYRIDGITGTPSVLVRSDRLMPADAGPAVGSKPYLNGIVYNPDGFLIAADYTRGKLWKVPLANPSAFTEVQLPERLKGPDGLVMRSPRELIAVQTFPVADGAIEADVEQLVSDDDWTSARVVAAFVPPGISGATTGTLRDGEIWIANSHWPELFADPTGKRPVFSVQHVPFDALRN
jgi:sugar lactone lactonase YvrE